MRRSVAGPRRSPCSRRRPAAHRGASVRADIQRLHSPAGLRRESRLAVVSLGEALGRTAEAADHLILGAQRTSGDLLLKATHSVTIAVISLRERKRWQPGLETDGPEFVGRPQLVRGIQRT
jgi:hypothetical protein